MLANAPDISNAKLHTSFVGGGVDFDNYNTNIIVQANSSVQGTSMYLLLCALGVISSSRCLPEHQLS